MNALILILWILIGIATTCLVVLNYVDSDECEKVRLPTYKEVLDSYQEYKFKDKRARRIADIIAEYKLKDSPFTDLSLNELSDYAVYLIITSDILNSDNTRKLVVISDPNYIDVVKAYNVGLEKFADENTRKLAIAICSKIMPDNTLNKLFENLTDREIYDYLLYPRVPN